MPLMEQLETSGNWLFRRRGYFPVVVIGILVPAIPYFSYPYGNHLYDQLWEILCLVVSSLGLIVRCLAVGYTPKKTSGRNTGEGQVADFLNTRGMYSIVRHPLYLGNFFMGLGVSMFLRVWWVSLIYILLFALYYERIMLAEEKYLREKFGRAFMDWAARTPAFIPKFKLWQTPELPFSWRKIIRKEYHSCFALVLCMYTLEVVTDFYLHGFFVIDWMWMGILGFILTAYIVVRLLHKTTSFLKTPGR